MYCFLVDCFAITASFRVPETHTFHQTLPLPPLTSLVGIMGAAKGLNYEDALFFSKENEISFGVKGTSQGKGKDLWKIRKVTKNNDFKKDIILREFLLNLEMTIALASYKKDVVEELRDCFKNPCYALSAGPNDNLLKISKVGNVLESSVSRSKQFQNTILPGNSSYDSKISLENIPISQSISAPEQFLLPVDYNFARGRRKVCKKEHFTFIKTPVEVHEPIDAVFTDRGSIPLLSLG